MATHGSIQLLTVYNVLYLSSAYQSGGWREKEDVDIPHRKKDKGEFYSKPKIQATYSQPHTDTHTLSARAHKQMGLFPFRKVCVAMTTILRTHSPIRVYVCVSECVCRVCKKKRYREMPS